MGFCFFCLMQGSKIHAKNVLKVANIRSKWVPGTLGGHPGPPFGPKVEKMSKKEGCSLKYSALFWVVFCTFRKMLDIIF